ncbi:PKD domain-containing protein [Moritella marina ATCC 15381]|uniref:PKD domain-containing protein n=1 Tax=Moritella marina ATCC 15381 TaxID=1202962 RepID=A0A5J6WMR9_MORMI|nr:PKD domain-containing protein [Moritella marina]QFI39267.1 PKD domain-containing protein [Moritella marina ATCC 15381]
MMMKKLLLVAILSTLTACGSEDIFDADDDNNTEEIISSVTFTHQPSDVNSPLYYFDATYAKNGQEYRQDDILWHWSVSLDGIGEVTTLYPEEDPQYQFLEADTYRVKATVSDTTGDELESYYQDIIITSEQITNAIIQPVAIISVLSINGLNVEFDAQNSTYSEGDLSEYEWMIEGAIYSTAVKTHTFNESGQYSVSLKVKATDGSEHSVTTTIRVSAEPTEPVANFTYTASNLLINFDASSSSNTSSDINSYNWYFPYDGSSVSGLEVTKEFPVEDAYSVALTVISNEGIEKEIIKTIHVNENAAYVTCDILTSSHTIYRARDEEQCFTSIENGPLTTSSSANVWCNAQITKYKDQMSRIFTTNLTYEVRQQGNNECSEPNEL